MVAAGCPMALGSAFHEGLEPLAGVITLIVIPMLLTGAAFMCGRLIARKADGEFTPPMLVFGNPATYFVLLWVIVAGDTILEGGMWLFLIIVFGLAQFVTVCAARTWWG